MKKINIVFFSANRAEYGLIYPFLKVFLKHKMFNVEFVVAGSHFSKKFGLSIKEIEKDKIKYTKINLPLSTNSLSNTSDYFNKLQNNHIHLIGDAFFAFAPSFAQGASQSIEGAYELFKSIENNTDDKFFKNRVNKTKMINIRSKFNQFAFHLSNPFTIFTRNIFLKRLVKNKKFLESYLGKVYR